MVFSGNSIVRILIWACLVFRGQCQDGTDVEYHDKTVSSTETSESSSDTSEISTSLDQDGDTTSITPIVDASSDTIYTVYDDNSTDSWVTEDSSATSVVDDDGSTDPSTNNATLDEGHTTPESNATACTPEPCRNGGTCVEEWDLISSSFSCLCPPGHTGIRCGVQDLCTTGASGKMCEGGSCVYTKDGLTRHCACFQDMYWDAEQERCRDPDLPCFPNPCGNGGTCVPEGESLRCNCTTGFEGKNCSILNNCGECVRGDCLLDEKSSTKICRCDDGLYWNEKKQACENITSPCLPEPCSNGGTCTVYDDDYNCSCAEDFSGETCEVVDKCSEDEDCGGHGNCSLSDDETMRTCYCDEGFYLHEPSHTCNKIEMPCHPNPCFHDGICTPISETNFNCTCSTGYTGATCVVRDHCEMDGGKAFCTSAATCTDMIELDVYVCTCEDGKYFDYSSRTCRDLDMCPLIRCDIAETCIGGKCECQHHWYRENNNQSCKPNICATNPCPGFNMTCEEGSGSLDYKCHCGEGYAFNGTHCNEATCIFPILNECGQHCKVINDGYDCDCAVDFHLNEDNKTCSYDGSSNCVNKTCDGGSCVTKSGKESCICPSGYVEKNGQCMDVCTANQMPKGVCPLNMCENITDGGFRCRCEGKYALSNDKATCTVRNICLESETGGKACSNKNGLCVLDWEKEGGFRCDCVNGLIETTGGMCRDVCSIENFLRICSAKRATCDVDKDGKMICKCPPYFQKNKDGICNKPADMSVLVTLPLDPSAYQKESSRKKRSLDDTLDYRKMGTDVTLAATALFVGFTEANILTCRSETGYMICKIEMQFTKVKESDLRRLMSDKLCIDMEGSNSCLLPPSLVLVKDRISENVVIKGTDPCQEEISVKLCGSETTCVSSPQSKSFNCSCKPGFTVRSRSYPFENTRSVVESCRDIDECAEGNPCPANSQCQNTIGGFLCPCIPGFRSLQDKCVEICSPNPCTHGTCSTRGEHEFDCTCKAGYRGALCDLEDKNFKGARINTVIVGVVLGGILLITIVLFAVCVSRLKRKKYFDDPGHMVYNSTEMGERGRINNAFQRETSS